MNAMATSPNSEVLETAAKLLICLPPTSAEAQTAALEHVRSTFTDEAVMIAVAALSAEQSGPSFEVVAYATPRSQLGWVLAAGDYGAAAALAQQHDADVVLLLGNDASLLAPETLCALVQNVRSGADLALPRYEVGAHDALVTSAILYPVTRALFAEGARFPLPLDVGMSAQMLQRLASVAGRNSAQGTEALVWPVAEAAAAMFRVQEVDAGKRTMPVPSESDLNTLLAAVAGSLFADVESKAAFWQRARSLQAASAQGGIQSEHSTTDESDTAGMLEAFRLASANLGEIWSLVLPPQSMVAIKKLSRANAEEFKLDPSLWARIVYDFALAFHWRTLNRSHLLGAMTPLYLAWVASHLRAAGEDAQRAARLVEAGAQAFEREKPYLVSRWRWPDRFNP